MIICMIWYGCANNMNYLLLSWITDQNYIIVSFALRHAMMCMASFWLHCGFNKCLYACLFWAGIFFASKSSKDPLVKWLTCCNLWTHKHSNNMVSSSIWNKNLKRLNVIHLLCSHIQSYKISLFFDLLLTL